MNRLLFLTLLFGACTVQAHIGDGDEPKPLTGAGAADVDAALGVNIDLNAGGLADAGAGIAKGLGETLMGVGEGLSAGGKALLKGGGNFVQAIVDFLKKIIEGLVKAILGLLNAITEQIDKAEKALFNQVGLKRIGGFRSVVNKLGESLKDTTLGVVNGLGSVAGGLVDTLKGNVKADVELGVGGHGHGGEHHHGGKGGKGGKGEKPGKGGKGAPSSELEIE